MGKRIGRKKKALGSAVGKPVGWALGSTLGNQVVWDEGVVCRREHASCVVPHERVSLHVQIPEHFIQTPPSDEADDVGVNLRQEKRRGARRPEAVGRDVTGQETEVRPQERHGLSDAGGDS